MDRRGHRCGQVLPNSTRYSYPAPHCHSQGPSPASWGADLSRPPRWGGGGRSPCTKHQPRAGQGPEAPACGTALFTGSGGQAWDHDWMGATTGGRSSESPSQESTGPGWGQDGVLWACSVTSQGSGAGPHPEGVESWGESGMEGRW